MNREISYLHGVYTEMLILYICTSFHHDHERFVHVEELIAQDLGVLLCGGAVRVTTEARFRIAALFHGLGGK